jgi:radical SAM superfamily enzyme YgiQ (UPF0313 family)
MKLLLVNAIDTSNSVETAYPPLGLAYLASSLKKRFPAIEVRIIDRDLTRVLASFAPDAVGISSVSQNFGRATAMAAACKAARIPVFVGGVHISLLPESLPQEFDFGVCGEAEETIVEIAAQLLADPGLINTGGLEKIRGLVLHSENGPKLTPPRPLITDLDSIAPPDRSLLSIPAGGIVPLFISRGCPYKCVFCASARFWNKVRWFSPDYVAAEAQQIVEKYRPRTLAFYDDLLVSDLPRLERIVELLCASGIHKKVSFTFASRADLVDEDLLRIVSPLDIRMISVGLESGSGKTLEYLKGESASTSQNMRAVELLAGAGISVQGTFVIGSPDETEAEVLQTLDFIKASRLETFNFYVLTPFPGTPVWEAALKLGLVSNHMDWDRLAIDQESLSERRIIMSRIPRDRLAVLYKLFIREKKIRRVKYLLKAGIRAVLPAASKFRARRP